MEIFAFRTDGVEYKLYDILSALMPFPLLLTDSGIWIALKRMNFPALNIS